MIYSSGPLPTYPLSLQAQWQNVECVALSAQLLDWLVEPNSLTQRLKSLSQQFAVEVLSERLVAADTYQSDIFSSTSAQLRVREVILFCDNRPMVYAQSWIPCHAHPEQGVDLTHLGDTPLGEVIFQDPMLSRQQLQVADFSANSDLQALTQSFNLPTQPLWGRRSRFNLTGQEIMVCEVFLPGAYPYL
ncbi:MULTISPECIES: chorismate--pyruvate lyase family protein [unclassified Pseudoalteromonas]|uniref:chorismate--pyruvate lyase family protein n=1 Tax=unclassified Pseudoalteromonas TaxID=194690 RepID=UPI000CF66F7F|nr:MULTISPECIES: chorismate lyase [unclassified Pseudoalteromonas]MBS3798301.1 chorismate lyase [Pseudoalteromonas sp. BDTF-M6]